MFTTLHFLFLFVFLQPPSVLSTHLTIGSFNVQSLGLSKINTPAIQTILSKITCRYDILSILEVKDKSELLIARLLESVNRVCGGGYNFVVNRPQGRSENREQVVVLYRFKRVTWTDAYAVNDVAPSMGDTFERSPFVVVFQTRDRKFRFTAIAVHVQPRNAPSELEALEKVYHFVRRREEKAHASKLTFIMGDLNCDAPYLSKTNMTSIAVLRAPFVPLVRATPTSTITDHTYDTAIVHRDQLAFVQPGSSGVDRYGGGWDSLGWTAWWYYGTDGRVNAGQWRRHISDHFPIRFVVDTRGTHQVYWHQYVERRTGNDMVKGDTAVNVMNAETRGKKEQGATATRTSRSSTRSRQVRRDKISSSSGDVEREHDDGGEEVTSGRKRKPPRDLPRQPTKAKTTTTVPVDDKKGPDVKNKKELQVNEKKGPRVNEKKGNNSGNDTDDEWVPDDDATDSE